MQILIIFIIKYYCSNMKVFIFIYNSLSDSGVARRGKGDSSPPPPRNPGKFAKDEEQPKPQNKFTLQKHLKNFEKF